ncbi:hypothetical protein PAHAL_6G174400 [Panicum hallii]|uniref:Uncharacterized protein n=1 Tax=Panicum hallii TaxID=206008 RepID=A0A2T8IGS2_9POAL|nr:hypothetical protein PAHAL_6G174400 [Panicum hallii]
MKAELIGYELRIFYYIKTPCRFFAPGAATSAAAASRADACLRAGSRGWPPRSQRFRKKALAFSGNCAFLLEAQTQSASLSPVAPRFRIAAGAAAAPRATRTPAPLSRPRPRHAAGVRLRALSHAGVFLLHPACRSPLPLDSARPPPALPLRAPLARRRRLPVRAPATSPVPASAPSLPRMFLLHPRLRLPFGCTSQILVLAQRLPPPLHALLPRRRSRPIRAFPSRRRCPPPLPLTPMLVASEPC